MVEIMPDTIKELCAKVLANLADQGQVTTLLSSVTEQADLYLAKQDQAEKDAARLAADNESLRKSNMTLFLKLGEQQTEETKSEEKSKEPEVSYLDLYLKGDK